MLILFLAASNPVRCVCFNRPVACSWHRRLAEKPIVWFVGELRHGVTPVPIPNTAVKPMPPMILLCGKVGYRRLLTPDG